MPRLARPARRSAAACHRARSPRCSRCAMSRRSRPSTAGQLPPRAWHARSRRPCAVVPSSSAPRTSRPVIMIGVCRAGCRPHAPGTAPSAPGPSRRRARLRRSAAARSARPGPSPTADDDGHDVVPADANEGVGRESRPRPPRRSWRGRTRQVESEQQRTPAPAGRPQKRAAVDGFDCVSLSPLHRPGSSPRDARQREHVDWVCGGIGTRHQRAGRDVQAVGGSPAPASASPRHPLPVGRLVFK